jgi:hypothetical protein
MTTVKERIVSIRPFFASLSLSLALLAATPAVHGQACSKALLPNAAPTANDDIATWLSGSVAIDVLANDGDIDGDSLSIAGISAVSGGTATVNGNMIVFTPAAGAISGRFGYTVNDGHSHTSQATAYLTVDVDPVSTPPIAVADNANVTAIGAPVNINVLANDIRDMGATLVVTSLSVVSPQGYGHVVKNADNSITYTPDVLADATFTYTIADASQPDLTSSATVTVHAPASGAVTVTKNCTDGVCSFTAVAQVTAGIVNYAWRWGDNTPNQPYVAGDKAWHEYLASGTYPLSVTVNYADGSTKVGTLSVVITYSASATWDLNLAGLAASIENIRGLQTFPVGTSPAINWAPNADDCVRPQDGCGRDGSNNLIFSDQGSCPTTCRLTGGWYVRTGTYNATLRFHRISWSGSTMIEEVFKDYPLVIDAINAAPEPTFTVARPDPNVRSYHFDNIDINDEGPYPQTFEWNFGDGTRAYGPDPQNHLYATLGTYYPELTVTDAEGKSGVYSLPLVVTNAPPVPRITVNCKLLDCELGGESSFDDGNNIALWEWNFGDGTTATGARVTHHYAAGCFTVTLKVTDGNTGFASTTQKVVAGPPLVAGSTGVVVDAHVQSYYGFVNGETGWFTTDGNLNGILEPGETVVVEPTWHTTPSTQNVAVTSAGIYPWGNYYGFRDFAFSYDVSTGVSDCWSVGRCYGVFMVPQYATNRPVHSDIQFNETNLATAQPTPGSPVTIHVGKSFTDVDINHWAYAGVESILHAGLDGGCGGALFCPGNTVSRGDVAKWLMKAEHGAAYQAPSCTAAPFTDVPCSHPMASWIGQLKAEGLTTGVGGGNYAPDAPLSRAEAAVFLLKTKLGTAYVPPACNPDFGDVVCGGASPHWAAAWISDIKTRGISGGCGLTEFCPNDPVDKAQAASLFAKTFNLRIDTQQCPVPTNGGRDVVPTHVIQSPIVSITFNPNPAVVGGNSAASMVLGDPPPVATTVTLSIDSPAATVPATAPVNAYATSAGFAVTPAANLTTRTTTHITATYLGYQKIVALDICTQPPTIQVPPTSRIINAPNSTTLTVSASGGGGPLSYQWYQGTSGNLTMPAGTGPSLTVTPAVTTSYWVNVIATCGNVFSPTATVTVCNLPAIASQPPSLIISSGATTTLSVTATGSSPLTYQWFQGTSGNVTTPVAGATASSYTTPNLYGNRSYWVRVTSNCNGTVSVDSTTANITTVTAITRVQSVSTTAESQQSITGTWPLPTQQGNLLVAIISGSNGTLIGNFTTPAGWVLAKSYEWNNIKSSIYYVPNCAANHAPEKFSVINFPDLTLYLAEYTWIVAASPLDQTGFDGDNFARPGGIVATGNTGSTAQASEVAISSLTAFANTAFTSPTNSFVRLTQQVIGNQLTTAVHERIVTAAGVYGHGASTTSNTQWLGLIATFKGAPPQPPAISSLTFNPSPATTGTPSTGTLVVGIPPSTATNVPLTIDNPAGATIPASVLVNAGQTTGTFTVTPASVSSRTITNITASYLGVNKTTQLDICPPAPTISAQPTSRTINAGQPTTLSVTASGSGTLTYQWYQGTSGTITAPVSGATGSSLTVTPAATTSYWVSVGNGCGGVASATATVTVCTPPGIAVQPVGPAIPYGQTATLTVTASGSGPFFYQWYQGTSGTTNAPISGATGSSYTTPPLGQVTSYWVRVSSSCNGGSINSNTATLGVYAMSAITRVQLASGTAQSQHTITVNWGQPTQAGDLLVAVFSASNVAAIGNFTPPAGWQLAKSYEWNNIKNAIYYIPNCASGRTSETFTAPNFPDLILQLGEYSGIATVSPLDRTAFDGDHTPANGTTVQTGTTPVTAQSKELVITALTTYAQTSFTAATNSFAKLSDLNIGWNLTTAMYERIVTTPAAYGHSASVGGNTQWLGLAVTFKSADTTAALTQPATIMLARGGAEGASAGNAGR